MNKTLGKYRKYLDFSFFSYTSFSIKKQTFFAKRLSFLIRAGIPILESVSVIRRQAKSKSEARVLGKIAADIMNGQSLAGSLAKFKGIFSSFMINVIRAGESSGALTENLNYLADELRKKELLRKRILSSMFYPLIILIATFGITGLLIVYIFPKILPIFKSLNVELPITTRAVIFLSDTLRNYGFWILLGLVLVVIAVILLKKHMPRFQYFYDGLMFKVPFMGKIIKNYNLTNIMRTMGLLLRSGLTLTESILITADTTENRQYKKALENISHEVIKGRGMADHVRKYPALFPEITENMIAVGERSGNLSNTFTYLSEFYENEFDDLTKNLSSALEPVLMIVMGVIVGFVAISVITPIYSITQNLKVR
ncbi:MAG: type II secretion system F family protein [Patescibacteria group bacterium]